ncbi:MAG: DUF202 domain-containing protein [Actinobacteria bacterium]|nr:MAG: DUF202 domain-containing protein [Actinomycetota bacterium]
MTSSWDEADRAAASHAERTALAWRRTGATFFVVALALGKMVIARSEPAVLVLAAAGLAAAVFAAMVAHRRQKTADPEGTSALFPAAITASVVLVATAAALDLMLALAG